MSDAAHDTLSRFLVAHSRCGGEVAFSDPTVADFVDNGEKVWVAARCGGCGASTRELVSTEEMFAYFFQLLEAAGVGREQLVAAIERNDQQEIERISALVRRSPAMLRSALQDIRRAQEGETQN